jgi:hypothetical protein
MCLRLAGETVMQTPLGELVHLGDVGLREAPIAAMEVQEGVTALTFPETGQTLYSEFFAFWRAHGGEDILGPPITPELFRGDAIVQYTRYARLERPRDGPSTSSGGAGAVRLGQLGEEYLRLPGGVPYRWP